MNFCLQGKVIKLSVCIYWYRTGLGEIDAGGEVAPDGLHVGWVPLELLPRNSGGSVPGSQRGS